ncbi:MAG: hypothetical protein WAM94_14450 [Chromatiaceae bacterium]
MKPEFREAFNNPAGEILVQDNPKGMKMRRARRSDEPWPQYFRKVLLWPYDKEHYNKVFITLDQGGHKVQFVPNIVFDVDGQWILVLRGDKGTVRLMGDNVILEAPRDHLVLRPGETSLIEDPREEAWLGFVIFPKPEPPVTEVMSSFALFGNAGGVAAVLDEDRVRREKFLVPRDVLDLILETFSKGN